MKNQPLKQKTINAIDFSDRSYFPGTPSHPFHTITAIQEAVSKVPAPIYSLLLGGIVYLFLGNITKALIIIAVSLLDWILLSLLPIFHISYGPPNLTALVLAVMRLPFLVFPLPITLGIQGIGTLLVLYGFYLEPLHPKVTKYQLTIQGLGVHSHTIRIVHLSDLHMEFITKREERIIEKINAIAPDLVLFTGDYFNLSYQHDQHTYRDIVKFFDQLHTKSGIYGVTGSPAVDLEESIAAIAPDMKLNLLRDSCHAIDIDGAKIELVGLNCSHRPENDATRLAELLKDHPVDARILLYHSPDIAPAIEALPIDLQVSGHTHGGQVQVPFIGAIYSGSLYGLKFTNGFYLINKSPYLIISRGLGLEGDAAPRVRFLSPPEIGLITVEIAPDNVQ